MITKRVLTPALIVLAIAFIVLLFNSGSRFAIGLLLKPMADDLVWTRGTLSLAVTVFMTVTALSLPVIGRLVDTLGPKRILAGGILLTGISLGLMMLVRTPVQAIVVYGLLFGIGSAATSITPIGVIITRWFPHRAGIANSVAISGMGMGQLAVIAVLSGQLERLGWRGAFIALAAVNLFVLLPLILLALRPYPAAENAAHALAQGNNAKPDSRYGFLQSRPLWLLLLIYGICGFQDFFVATHLVAFALDQGVQSLIAGNMLALMGLFGLVGVLVTGVWAVRSGPTWPTLACFALRIALFAMILVDRSLSSIVLFALLYGLTFWVTAPLTVVFARLAFGSSQLGVVTGSITMVHHFAGGLGAYFGAAVFDATGNYDGALALMLALSLIATALSYAARNLNRVSPE